MNTKLLKRIRRKANFKYFQRGTEVLMSIYSTDIDPPFIVIYECHSEPLAQRMCEYERTKMMNDTVQRLRMKKKMENNIKTVKKIRRKAV